ATAYHCGMVRQPTRVAGHRLSGSFIAGLGVLATHELRQLRLTDPFRDGIASRWKEVDASALAADALFDADVAIVGSGAGGGTAAEILSSAGLEVVLIEEGPLEI